MTEQITHPKQRIHSIDILRGLVMIIMALDHTRDFFHQPALTQDATALATTTPVLFFTRWITHFCAPTFVFLSGISAYMAGQRKTKKEQSSFLITRGLWLILIEITVMTFALTFNPLFNFIMLDVLWAIGFSMIILGLITRTSMSVIIIVGCLLFFGHNVFDYINLPQEGFGSFLLKMLIAQPQTIIPYGNGRIIAILYTALPWTGVMLLGYAFGTLYQSSVKAGRRKAILMSMGVIFTLSFIILRFMNMYGDPSHWSVQKDGIYTFLSFLNTTKYPPSLMFCTMTLGPSCIFLSLAENIQNRFSKILMVYGRVPFFYFVVHFYIIHILCVILFFASGYVVDKIVDPQVPFLFRPASFGFDLWVVYLLWICLIIALYKPCKWFIKYKATHNQWWLSYV
ncbi:MAG: heparan-alpha-glucosaminide N-acetyltransferase domain-containing protein [Panacibacter sp.]